MLKATPDDSAYSKALTGSAVNSVRKLGCDRSSDIAHFGAINLGPECVPVIWILRLTD